MNKTEEHDGDPHADEQWKNSPGQEQDSHMQMIPGQFHSSAGLTRARALLNSVSDFRAGKVARLKTEISHGRYHIDSYEIARKMVDEALQEGGWMGEKLLGEE